MRSGRIDHKIKLDYADEYQIENMYKSYLPDQEKHFKKFYKSTKHLQISPAVFQEFFFRYESCDNILDHVEDLNTILNNNESKAFELINASSENLYS